MVPVTQQKIESAIRNHRSHWDGGREGGMGLCPVPKKLLQAQAGKNAHKDSFCAYEVLYIYKFHLREVIF